MRSLLLTTTVVLLSFASCLSAAGFYVDGEVGGIASSADAHCADDCRGILDSTPYISIATGAVGDHFGVMLAGATTPGNVAELTLAQLQASTGIFYLRAGRIVMPFGNLIPAQSIPAPSHPAYSSTYLIPLHDALGLADLGASLEIRGVNVSGSFAAFRPKSLTLRDTVQLGTFGGFIPEDLQPAAVQVLGGTPPGLVSPLLRLIESILGVDPFGSSVDKTTKRRVSEKGFAVDLAYSGDAWNFALDSFFIDAEHDIQAHVLSLRYTGQWLVTGELIGVGDDDGIGTRGIDLGLTIPLNDSWAWFAQAAKFDGGLDAAEWASGLVWRHEGLNIKAEVRRLVDGAALIGADAPSATVGSVAASYSFHR